MITGISSLTIDSIYEWKTIESYGPEVSYHCKPKFSRCVYKLTQRKIKVIDDDDEEDEKFS